MKSLKASEMDQISYPRLIEIYKDRFADASDFTFTFVGNLNIDSMRPLIQQYLATLPSIHRTEKADVSHEPANISAISIGNRKHPKRLSTVSIRAR